MGIEILKARKARGLGLDQDPKYRHRHDNFVDNLTAVQLLTKLRKEYAPTDEQFTAYYETHPEEFTVPERRRVQQIVVKTKKEAKRLREQILKETTDDYDPFYKLAQERSIDPTAGRTSGILGWVIKGDGTIIPALEKATFALGLKEVSRPVESPRGYHLIRSVEIVAGEKLSLDAINSSDKRGRYDEMLLKEKLEPYLAGLRKEHKVVVDEVWFGRGPQPQGKEIASQGASPVTGPSEGAATLGGGE
jgi:parvulin-like peptidyl-prolyl isomerase